MTARRWTFTIGAATAAAVALFAMVRYTQRVERQLTTASAEGTTVRLLRERQPVPAFKAVDVHGRAFSTADYRNKVILVNFWATWCPPCREEIPDLIALQAKYTDQLQIVGISQDAGGPDAVAQFAAAHGMNYPVLMTTPEIERLFPSVYALPTSFLIDRDGRIAQKHVGMLNPSLTEIEARTLAGLDVNARVVFVEDEEKAKLENAAQANKIPGIDLSALSPERKTQALQQLNTDHCTCGCGLTVAQCRLDDPTCPVSLPLAQSIVKKIAGT